MNETNMTKSTVFGTQEDAYFVMEFHALMSQIKEIQHSMKIAQF